MKFNIGDKVVDSRRLELLFNPYHKETMRRKLVETVTDADERYFTVTNEKGRYNSPIEYGMACGMNEYVLWLQDGRQKDYWFNKKRCLHLEKDKDMIRLIIEKLREDAYSEEKKRYEESIASATSRFERFKETHERDIEITNGLLGL